MKLHFYGAAKMVTGSNYLLETDNSKILIDCGLFQGGRKIEKKNEEPFPYLPKEIDFVLITHAHLDHIGRLPKLIENGFKGEILSTNPTKDFARLILKDSQKILREKAKRAGVIPLVEEEHIENIMKMFRAVKYDEKIKLNEEISVCFREAGHVLGSASIEVMANNKKIVFSGDLGSSKISTLREPAIIKDADYVIVESTYGDRVNEEEKECKDMIEDIVEEAVARGGTLMIPSFALERTQQLLYHFNELVENKRIPQIPIFVDSPLAIKLTDVYKQYPEYYNKKTNLLVKSGDDIFKFPGLKFTLLTKESKEINDITPPKIIIAGAGMSQGGRIIHHEARYLSDPKNTLLIVTYQARGTLGRKILEGASEVKILDKIIPIKAKIEHINGYSSHADQKDLIVWVSNTICPDSSKRPKKIFVCHGEEEPANTLAQYIKDNLGLSVQVPEMGEIVEL